MPTAPPLRHCSSPYLAALHQVAIVCQIPGVGEKREEIAVWHDESGFFFCEVKEIGVSCGEEESGCGDNLDGEKMNEKEKMNVSGDDDSAPWTESGFGGGLGEVTGIFHGLCDASQSD
jgi:hypothetical protein